MNGQTGILIVVLWVHKNAWQGNEPGVQWHVVST